jgi:hypothetical protein
MKTIKHIVLASALSMMFVGCAGDRYHRSTGAYIDDKSTTAKVKADLLSDPIVKGSQVKVQTYGGKVQLAGFVDSQQQKNRAGEIARRVNGVQWVKNDLIVKAQAPMGAPATASGYRTFNEPAGAGVNAGVNAGSTGAGVSAGANAGGAGASGSVGTSGNVNTDTSKP